MISSRAERKAAKRREIAAIERERRLAAKRAALDEALSLVHHDGSSFDAADRLNAVLVDESGYVLARKVEPPAGLGAMSRSVEPHPSLPDGHPRSTEVSAGSKALIRDEESSPWGGVAGVPRGVDPVLLGE